MSDFKSLAVPGVQKLKPYIPGKPISELERELGIENIIKLDGQFAMIQPEIRQQIERDALYANYIDRQQADIDRLRKDEALLIPTDFNYSILEGLSNELKGKLSFAQPSSLAQAAMCRAPDHSDNSMSRRCGQVFLPVPQLLVRKQA